MFVPRKVGCYPDSKIVVVVNSFYKVTLFFFGMEAGTPGQVCLTFSGDYHILTFVCIESENFE